MNKQWDIKSEGFSTFQIIVPEKEAIFWRGKESKEWREVIACEEQQKQSIDWDEEQ